jgi:hypothetical protein
MSYGGMEWGGLLFPYLDTQKTDIHQTETDGIIEE